MKNQKMKKKELKSSIEETINLIKTNSKDVKFAGELLDKLMSLKGQIDVEPTRLIIPEKDVIKEYDMDSFRFVRCKSCIIFQDKGGMTVVVNPRMTALFQHLNTLLNMKDDFENLSDDLKKSYSYLLENTVYIMNLPIYATCDDEMFFGIGGDIIQRLQTMVEKKEKELKDETYKENADFENMKDALESISSKEEE